MTNRHPKTTPQGQPPQAPKAAKGPGNQTTPGTATPAGNTPKENGPTGTSGK